MLSIGQAVPAIEVEALTPQGEYRAINFSDHRYRWKVLFFWQWNFTITCLTHIRAYHALARQFAETGAILLGASMDSVAVLAHPATCMEALVSREAGMPRATAHRTWASAVQGCTSAARGRMPKAACPAYAHRAWTTNGLGKVSFPLIGDATRQLASRCGVLSQEEGMAEYATFIIEPGGHVAGVVTNAINAAAHGIVPSAALAHPCAAERSAQDALRMLWRLQSDRAGVDQCPTLSYDQVA